MKSGSITEADAQANRMRDYERDLRKWRILDDAAGPYGTLSNWPWFENRGPNPYLWVTNQQNRATLRSKWEFIRGQTLVLLEPLVKFLTPIIYLLQPGSGFWNKVYFVVILVDVGNLGVFGGAITAWRPYSLPAKRRSASQALSFTRSRYVSFLSAAVPLCSSPPLSCSRRFTDYST